MTNWSDPRYRAVISDALTERGLTFLLPIPPYNGYIGCVYGDGSDGDADSDGFYSDGGGGGTLCGDGYGAFGGYGGYGDSSDGGGGGGGGCGDGGDDSGSSSGGSDSGDDGVSDQRFDAREGLFVVISRGGFYPLVRVGYLRHVEGDEWEIIGARIITRPTNFTKLLRIALIGPTSAMEVLAPSKMPEPLHWLHVTRVIRANPERWRFDKEKMQWMF